MSAICGGQLDAQLHGQWGRPFQAWAAGSDPPRRRNARHMHDDGDSQPHSPATQSKCATLRCKASNLWQILELLHRNFDCTLEVTPIGGVTQLSCETGA